MKQRNFILTDIMKTGQNQLYEGFIRFNTLSNQKFDIENEYYFLHNLKKKYDRKIALLDISHGLKGLKLNQEFTNEMKKRIKKLKKQGFKIILALPWESYDNFIKGDFSIKEIEEEVKKDYLWTGQQSWFWFYMVTKHTKNNLFFNHNNKKYDFLYLNKQPRAHRLKLYEKLVMNKSLENSLYSFTDHENSIQLNFDYELPWLDTKKRYPRHGFDQDIYEKPYNETGCSIVSETNDNNTDVFMTEKIWKPIIAGHVFIVHGNYQYLKKLKEIGYKTFESVFDESYDNIKDRNERIKVLAELIKSLKGSNWNDIYHKTESIRKHNQKNFWNKNHLKLLINKELLRWFEFVDNSQVSSTKS